MRTLSTVRLGVRLFPRAISERSTDMVAAWFDATQTVAPTLQKKEAGSGGGS